MQPLSDFRLPSRGTYDVSSSCTTIRTIFPKPVWETRFSVFVPKADLAHVFTHARRRVTDRVYADSDTDIIQLLRLHIDESERHTHPQTVTETEHNPSTSAQLRLALNHPSSMGVMVGIVKLQPMSSDCRLTHPLCLPKILSLSALAKQRYASKNHRHAPPLTSSAPVQPAAAVAAPSVDMQRNSGTVDEQFASAHGADSVPPEASLMTPSQSLPPEQVELVAVEACLSPLQYRKYLVPTVKRLRRSAPVSSAENPPRSAALEDLERQRYRKSAPRRPVQPSNIMTRRQAVALNADVDIVELPRDRRRSRKMIREEKEMDDASRTKKLRTEQITESAVDDANENKDVPPSSFEVPVVDAPAESITSAPPTEPPPPRPKRRNQYSAPKPAN